jgi:hypothetical protein
MTFLAVIGYSFVDKLSRMPPLFSLRVPLRREHWQASILKMRDSVSFYKKILMSMYLIILYSA